MRLADAALRRVHLAHRRAAALRRGRGDRRVRTSLCSTPSNARPHTVHRTAPSPWVHEGSDCDVDDLVEGADPASLTVVADAAQARRHGFRPAYQFVTFDCAKPA